MTVRGGNRTGAVAVAVAALTTGCAGQRRDAERAVRAYDEALVQAYRTSDVTPLKDVATEAESGRVLALIDLKRASRLVLEPSLESFGVTGVTRNGADGMLVRTRELWRYQDRPMQPGLPPGTLFVAQMEMEYDVVPSGARWKVRKVRSLRSEYLEPKGLGRKPQAEQPEPGGGPAGGSERPAQPLHQEDSR